MFSKMKKGKSIVSEIEVPQETDVEVKDNEITVSKGGKETKRRFRHVHIEKKDKKIIIKTARATKREIKQVNTIVAHIKNMLKGMEESFVYKLQICAVHFPMSVNVQEGFIVVKNFLGETKERKSKILPGVDVKISGDIISVTSVDKEAAGQTAANIEEVVKITNRDKRIFQDGIFMIEKANKEI